MEGPRLLYFGLDVHAYQVPISVYTAAQRTGTLLPHPNAALQAEVLESVRRRRLSWAHSSVLELDWSSCAVCFPACEVRLRFLDRRRMDHQAFW
jgi:hypothetical protein